MRASEFITEKKKRKSRRKKSYVYGYGGAVDSGGDGGGMGEGFANAMSVDNMIAYLRQHHDENLHPDYLNHLTTTNSKFVLKNIPLTSIRTELAGLDRAKVEQYKKMDFSKAPPIVVGSDGNILDGYHRATVAKALGISTIKAYVGVKGQQAAAEELEEGWKDWVAGGAMALGALGASAGDIVSQVAEKGDTVYSIARDNGVNPAVIMKLNGFTNDTKLKPGQEVKVPDVYTDKGSINKAVKQAIADKPDSKLAPKTSLKPKPRPTELEKPKTSNAHENLLIKTARAAGIKGTELAAFLSQVAHESHDFQSMVEYGGSLDFRKYDPKYAPKKAKTLGNTKAGDGAKFKGRGYIQITGKYNYKKAGTALGIDLISNPELAEKPAVAAKIAIWFWKLRVQPNVDDFSNVRDVTKPINPGMRGLEDRKSNFKDYKTMVASL